MKKIGVLYTGGTIGSAGQPLSPMKTADFGPLLASIIGKADGPLAASGEVSFRLESFEPPRDSSDIHGPDWIRMAQWVLQAYEHYDGFVILHGTDTLAWSASALSFLLRGLTKPVVITGSQLPLSAARSDATANVLNAVRVATHADITEVTVAFDKYLLRGNRTVKIHTSAFAAFDSPNFAPLGLLSPQLHVDQSRLLTMPHRADSLNDRFVRERALAQLGAMATRATSELAYLQLFPGITADVLRAVLRAGKRPLRGLILGCFGAGNAPGGADFLAELKAAHDAGVVIVDVTQVASGGVAIHTYQSGSALGDRGVISGKDLTPCAAYAKLWYLLAQGLSQFDVEEQMAINLAGEMCERRH